MAFELEHSNLLQQNVKGLKNQTPKSKFKLHDEKYGPEDPKICSI